MGDSYGQNDRQAHCSKCAKFMPWSRSVQVEKDTGIPAAAPALVEVGMCLKCEATHTKEG